jgi:hypothetical protein
VHDPPGPVRRDPEIGALQIEAARDPPPESERRALGEVEDEQHRLDLLVAHHIGHLDFHRRELRDLLHRQHDGR